MNDNETTADVISAMRDEAARADMEQDYSINDAAEMMREFAWRFEVAHKREAVTDCNQFGNAAKLREALISLRDAVRDFRHQIAYTKYNDIMDEYTCREKGLPAVLTLRDAIPKANLALAAPPRNCDLYKTKEKAQEAFLKEPCDHPCGNCWVEDINNECGVDWLLAPATEKEGGAK